MTDIQAAARQRRPLIALLVANYVSWFGNGLTIAAVPLYVLQETGSALATGLAGFANALPLVLGGLLGGVVTDRLGGRVVSVLADVSAGVLIVLVPLLDGAIGLPFGVLLILLAARTLVDTPGAAARLALLEPLTAKAGSRNESANALFSGAQRVALIAGPVCATLMAAFTSPATVLYIDGATFILSAALIWFFIGRVETPPQESSLGFVADLKEGLAAIRRIPVVRAILIVVVVTNFIDDGLAPVIFPIFSRDVLGDVKFLGLLLAMYGVGTVAGTFLYGPASRRLLSNRFATFIGAFAAIALMRALLAVTPGLAMAAIVVFLLGLASGPLNPLIIALLQERTPKEMQGRVFGVVLALAFLAAPFGILVQAWLVDVVGIRTTIWLFAILYGITVITAAFSRDLRSMSESRSQQS